jgi:hypothetical protein
MTSEGVVQVGQQIAAKYTPCHLANKAQLLALARAFSMARRGSRLFNPARLAPAKLVTIPTRTRIDHERFCPLWNIPDRRSIRPQEA